MEEKFNFNLRKSRIYIALKWEPFFKLIKIVRNISLFLTFAFFFLYILFSERIIYISIKNFIGFFLISLSVLIFCRLLEVFFESELKKPEPKISLVEALAEPGKYNLADFLSFEIAKVIKRISPTFFSKREITSTNLFYSLLEPSPNLNFIFSRLLLDNDEIRKRIKERLKDQEQKFGSKKSSFFDLSFQKVVIAALEIAAKKNHCRIEFGDMLISLSIFDSVFQKILVDYELKPEDIENIVWWFEDLESEIEKRKRFWDYDNLVKRGSLAKTWTAGYTITLDEYAIDWTEKMKKRFPKTIGHKKEIELMERILAGSGVNNVLLVSEPGVGIENMIYTLAEESLLGQSLPEINYKRVVELNMPLLLATIKSKEETEKTLNKIFQEVVSAGNIILVIKDFHNYIGQSEGLGMVDISGIIGQYLKMPQLQLVAVTTYTGLHENIEKKSSILNLFEKVEVPELSEKETLIVLEDMALLLEKKYKLMISYPALREVVSLSERYMPSLALPEKAIKILDDAAVYVAEIKEDRIVLPEHIASIITEKTEIPIGQIQKKEKEILLNLEYLIHKRIINQNEAVEEISSAMRRARSEVSIRKGPIGAFIFLGPTGVGKTETAKALAEVYFGSEERMNRLDMSEFQDIKDIPRLLGTREYPGILTTAVRENPFSVLLLDEIEKADYNIRNLFLQVLDEGFITDGAGKKVSFESTLIIATSNAGYKVILEALQEKVWPKGVKQRLINYLFQQGIFQPEFLNRFDAVIVFNPLSEQNVIDIAGLMLSKLAKNLKEKGIEFIVTDQLKEKVADLGYSPVFGAREMRRVIQDNIENVLASAMLAGNLKRGDIVEIDVNDFKLIINADKVR